MGPDQLVSEFCTLRDSEDGLSGLGFDEKFN